MLGKWSVFFFYPADFTFVCPTELEDLAEYYPQFQEARCEVYSISCDTHYVHKAWHDASPRIQKIQYPMLADPTHALSKDFEVYLKCILSRTVWRNGELLLSIPKGRLQLMR